MKDIGLLGFLGFMMLAIIFSVLIGAYLIFVTWLNDELDWDDMNSWTTMFFIACFFAGLFLAIVWMQATYA